MPSADGLLDAAPRASARCTRILFGLFEGGGRGRFGDGPILSAGHRTGHAHPATALVDLVRTRLPL